ncbi:MAG TPA: FHA domain-containing protein [Planctomycetota bacterium]|nr:FHA domain-containing protein [Planctomycetota bacterium]
MPKFIVQFQGQESVAELKPGANSVGRQSTNTIPLRDSTLSRLHCEVILAGTVATLLDKGSRNGTLLNGKKVEAQVLQPGDKVQIGATTLWYEKKNIAAEKPPPPKPAPAEGTPPTGSRAASPAKPAPATTRRAAAGEVRPSTASVRPPAPAAALSQIPDFAFHGKASGHGGKIVAAVLLLAILGVAGYYLRAFLDRPVAVDVDLDNLITRNPHFDNAVGGRPEGWTMRSSMSGEKSPCNATIDPTRGRNSSPGLMLEKAAGAGDLVAECGYQDDLPLAKGSALAASAWAQFDGFSGWAALKVDWLKSPRGAVISEEFSDPVKPTGWGELKATFTPPAGAGAFRFALAIIGRGGRVFFDDVSVKAQGGAPAGPEKKIGAYHRVAWNRAGVLQLDLRGGRRALTNLSVRLESEKEGMTPQAFSSDVVAKPDETGVSFEGKMVSPVDFREVVFNERIGVVDELTTVEYTFPGEALKQVDRVTVSLTLPRVDGPPRGIPESGDPTYRINCTAEEGEFAIEYSDAARVRYRTVDGRLRITQTWPVDPMTDTFTFRIREAGGGPDEVFDPVEQVKKLRTQNKLGEALTVARPAVKKVKEAAVREKLETEIRALEEQERRDWVEVQAQTFLAVTSRRADMVTAAERVIATYLKQWAGEGTEAKADLLQRGLREELRATPAAEAERPKRIFDRAKKMIETGKRALAESLLQTLIARYPSSEVAPEAQQLLKTLSQ